MMSHLGEDRRAYERYEMAVPCMITISDENVDSKLIEGGVKNISGGGIFLNGSGGIAVGATVKLDIVIPPRLIKCAGDGGTHISATGFVVRREKGGMAVSFREDYRISSLEQVLRILDQKRAWLVRQREKGLEKIQSNPSPGPGDNRTCNRQETRAAPPGCEDLNYNGEMGTPEASAYAFEA